ncbi:MAG: hypothetical protein JWM80_325 [Cyanobacteria bacterium RYN_339]|nr:hypothetical protein [Cyanobacteria bacterium RYN_339]
MLVELAVVAVAAAIGAAVLKRPRPKPFVPDDPRVAKVQAMHRQIREAVTSLGLEPVMVDQLVQVDGIVAGYRDLAAEEKRLGAYRRSNPSALVEKEITTLEGRLAHSEASTREMVEENLSILKLRLGKLEQIDRTHDALKAQLAMLEDTVRLVLDQTLTASSPAELAVDFRRLTRTIAATDEALAETRALLPEKTRNH